MKQFSHGSGVTTEVPASQRPDAEFDQWARAVREQMVAALKRRGSA